MSSDRTCESETSAWTAPERLADWLSGAAGFAIHPWRVTLTCAGGCLVGSGRADDLMAAIVQDSIKFPTLDRAREALALLSSLRATIPTRLADSLPILPASNQPQDPEDAANVLGDALLGIADGMDAVDFDPDELPPEALDAFLDLGERSALLLDWDALDDEDRPLEPLQTYIGLCREAAEQSVKTMIGV